MKLPKEAHVVVVERDIDIRSKLVAEGVHTPRGPMVWEHYLDEHLTKEAATKFAIRQGGRYGKFVICKLVPVGGNGYEPVGLIEKFKHLLAGLFGRKGA